MQMEPSVVACILVADIWANSERLNAHKGARNLSTTLAVWRSDISATEVGSSDRCAPEAADSSEK
jgi:hypothetical protein